MLLKIKEKKEAKEDHDLVANGSFQTWWLSILFNRQWKVPCLVSFGRRRRNIIFTSFHFSPHKILLKFFSIDFKVLFYHVFKPLLCIFPSFSLTYKLQSCISKYQIFHTLIAKLILIEYFFCSLTSWLANDYVLWASSHTNERKIAPRIIPKLNTNLAKS